MLSKSTMCLAIALLAAASLASATDKGDPKPKGDKSHHNDNSTQEQEQSQESNAAALALSGASVSNILEGDVYEGSEAMEFPVSTASLIYAEKCVNVLNAQGVKIGVGIGTQDRVCQWLTIAQARHVEMASFTCKTPNATKGGAFDEDSYKRCKQRKSKLWMDGDRAMENAEAEMCSKGLLKKAWAVIWTGTSKCAGVTKVEPTFNTAE